MRSLHRLLAGTALALVLGACTMSQSATKPGDAAGAPARPTLLSQMDADKDGKVSKAEFEAYRAAQFKSADKNNDGFVDKAEFDAYLAARRSQWSEGAFGRLDKNNDGKLTADEMADARGNRRAPQPIAFERLDRNKNGAITLAEYTAAARARLEARMKERMASPDGKAEGRPAPTADMLARMRQRQAAMAAETFKALDTDGNGTLSKAEYETGMAKPRLVLLADTDKDGSVSKAEFDAFTAKQRGQAARPAGRPGQPVRGGGMVERIDANKDGKISAAEWQARGDAMFAALDRNKDGFIAVDEMRGPRRAEGRPGAPAPKK